MGKATYFHVCVTGGIKEVCVPYIPGLVRKASVPCGIVPLTQQLGDICEGFQLHHIIELIRKRKKRLLLLCVENENFTDDANADG